MVRAAFTAALLLGWSASSQDVSITVRAFNQCNVRPQVLRNAEVEAAYLLGTAALHVLWVDCSKSGECDHELAPNEVAVLVRHSQPTPKHATKRDVLGKALVAPEGRSTYAMVYYDVHPRWRTPTNSIVARAICTLVLVFTPL